MQDESRGKNLVHSVDLIINSKIRLRSKISFTYFRIEPWKSFIGFNRAFND